MNKNYAVLTAIVLVLLGLGFLIRIGGDTNVEERTATVSNELHPIMHIKSGDITVTNGTSTHVAQEGESLTPPVTLSSNASGTGSVIMPDGSELRLDVNTTLALDQADLNPATSGTQLTAAVSLGRVWSSVIKLLTPESKWEVHTSNVVATVRGTSFSLGETATHTSLLLGSVHSVTIGIIDPETGVRKRLNDLPVGPGALIVMNDNLAKQVVRDNAPLATSSIPEALLNDPWYQNNQREDARVRKFIGTLGTTTADFSARQGEVLKMLQQENVGDTSSQSTSPEIQPTNSSGQTSTKSTPDPGSTQARTPTQGTSLGTKIPTSLTITSTVPLDGVVERTPVPLTATLHYSDDSTEDVTASVTWSVIGSVGSIDGTTFYPLLDQSIAELGKGIGSITAIWTNSAGTVKLLGKTAPFTVKAYVQPTTVQQAG